MTTEIIEVLCRFVEETGFYQIKPLGEGNINDTYLAYGNHGGLVLQRINSEVFPQPELVATNFVTISKHIAARIAGAHQQWQAIKSVPTLTGHSYFRDSFGQVWRAQSYLEGTFTRATIKTLHQAKQVGWALGRFHSLLADFPTVSFTESLPGLHNLPDYLNTFTKVLSSHGRPDSHMLTSCFDFLSAHGGGGELLEGLRRNGELTVQVIHGDPKADNVLFRKNTDKAVGLIDLDTVGVGPLHYDIGDCLRSCCNSAGENVKNTCGIAFDLEYCRSLLHGYYSAGENVVSAGDKRYIFEAVFCITFELGVRFLTDYLAGNRYFKVSHEDENLEKALLQFRLAEDICKKEDQIRRIGLGA